MGPSIGPLPTSPWLHNRKPWTGKGSWAYVKNSFKGASLQDVLRLRPKHIYSISAKCKITKNLRQYGKTKNGLCMNFQVFWFFNFSFFGLIHFSIKKYSWRIYMVFFFSFRPSKKKKNIWTKISLLIWLFQKWTKVLIFPLFFFVKPS
jgi:hypothetical protein